MNIRSVSFPPGNGFLNNREQHSGGSGGKLETSDEPLESEAEPEIAAEEL